MPPSPPSSSAEGTLFLYLFCIIQCCGSVSMVLLEFPVSNLFYQPEINTNDVITVYILYISTLDCTVLNFKININYYIKGKWEMHRLVVHIKFCTSHSACVPGLHLHVQCSGSFLMLLFFPGCGSIILPPRVGLKKVPLGGEVLSCHVWNEIYKLYMFQPFRHIVLLI